MLWSLGQNGNNRTEQGGQGELKPEMKPHLDSELVCAQKMAR